MSNLSRIDEVGSLIAHELDVLLSFPIKPVIPLTISPLLVLTPEHDPQD